VHRGVDLRAVAALERDVDLRAVVLAVDQPLGRGLGAPHLPRGELLGDVRAQQLLAFVPQHPRIRPVEILDLPVRVQDEQPVLGVLDQTLEQREPVVVPDGGRDVLEHLDAVAAPVTVFASRLRVVRQGVAVVTVVPSLIVDSEL